MLYRLGDDRPLLVADAWVAPNATVIGKIELQAQSSVWFNAVLRGDVEQITIGPKTNIQDSAVLHTDQGYPMSLGEGITVGHQVMLHGCVIEDYALIGINAVVLNGARIGAGAIIGANALITENTEIPPGSLVLGAPGRVVREVSEEESRLLRLSAEHYAANAARYQAQLQPID